MTGAPATVTKGTNGKPATVGGGGTEGFYAGTADTITSANDLQFNWIADARL
jgi:hypothetical protein